MPRARWPAAAAGGPVSKRRRWWEGAAPIPSDEPSPVPPSSVERMDDRAGVGSLWGGANRTEDALGRGGGDNRVVSLSSSNERVDEAGEIVP